jgi:hypothetical protein
MIYNISRLITQILIIDSRRTHIITKIVAVAASEYYKTGYVGPYQ